MSKTIDVTEPFAASRELLFLFQREK